MYGTLAGALSGRKVNFDRKSYRATVEGRISGIAKTIRIKAIVVHYDLTLPAAEHEAALRALQVHPQGCPAHQSVKDAIEITWDATLHLDGQEVRVSSAEVEAGPTDPDRN